MFSNTAADASERAESNDSVANGWKPWSPRALSTPFDETKSGIGRGESRVAVELSGVVVGGTYHSHDVVDSNGGLWEVKEPHRSRNGEVRVSGSRRGSLSTPLAELGAIVRCLREVAYDVSVSRVFDDSSLFALRDFVDDDAEPFVKGEVSRRRMSRLADALRVVRDAMRWNERSSQGNKIVELAKVRHSVDVSTYLQVAAALGLNAEDLDVSDLDVARSKLSSKAFVDPDAYVRAFWQSVLPSIVFDGLEGVVLVDIDGYRVLRRADLDEELKFWRVSAGCPFFRPR